MRIPDSTRWALPVTGLLLLVLWSGPVYAQEAPGNPMVPPPPIQTQSHIDVTVQAPPPDSKAIADASTQSFQAVLVNILAPTAASWADDLLNIPDILKTTPPDLTYGNSAVTDMVNISKAVALSLLAIAVFTVGVAVALSQHPSIGRLVFAALLSVTDLAWWHMGIDLNNAICAAIAAPNTADLIRPHMQLADIGADPAKAVGPAAMVIVYAVVTVLLLISAAFRLGLLDVLIAVGPLGLLCGSTEQTSSFYSRYLSLSVGTLFSQPLIVICLKLAPVIGAVASGIAGAILGVAILLLARRMPALLASGYSQSSGNGLGRAVAMLLFRKFT